MWVVFTLYCLLHVVSGLKREVTTALTRNKAPFVLDVERLGTDHAKREVPHSDPRLTSDRSVHVDYDDGSFIDFDEHIIWQPNVVDLETFSDTFSIICEGTTSVTVFITGPYDALIDAMIPGTKLVFPSQYCPSLDSNPQQPTLLMRHVLDAVLVETSDMSTVEIQISTQEAFQLDVIMEKRVHFDYVPPHSNVTDVPIDDITLSSSKRDTFALNNFNLNYDPSTGRAIDPYPITPSGWNRLRVICSNCYLRLSSMRVRFDYQTIRGSLDYVYFVVTAEVDMSVEFDIYMQFSWSQRLQLDLPFDAKLRLLVTAISGSFTGVDFGRDVPKIGLRVVFEPSGSASVNLQLGYRLQGSASAGISYSARNSYDLADTNFFRVKSARPIMDAQGQVAMSLKVGSGPFFSAGLTVPGVFSPWVELKLDAALLMYTRLRFYITSSPTCNLFYDITAGMEIPIKGRFHIYGLSPDTKIETTLHLHSMTLTCPDSLCNSCLPRYIVSLPSPTTPFNEPSTGGRPEGTTDSNNSGRSEGTTDSNIIGLPFPMFVSLLVGGGVIILLTIGAIGATVGSIVVMYKRRSKLAPPVDPVPNTGSGKAETDEVVDIAV